MRNVPINFAESIFEPFWDGGESYPDNEKYQCLSAYTFSYHQDAVVSIGQMWAGAQIAIENQPSGVKAAVMERDCCLDISGYDTFRVFAAVPKEFNFTVYCVIDGQEKKVIDTRGTDSTGEFDGCIHGCKITHIRIAYAMEGSRPLTMTLYWFGLANSSKQREMEGRKSPYTSDWEGCFTDEPEIKPLKGIFFDTEELSALREKFQQAPFQSMMEMMRAHAYKDLELSPEEEIGDFVAIGDRRWQRDRDMDRTPLDGPMERLAFVGIIDENMEMLRMACRMALSAAHHTYWCESIMGVFPGATWHHRSFTEERMCKACALVLDWAGSLLTWHGRNILYNAIIQKGLPRFESDFKTVEYIRDMNQGIVFSSGRIMALLVLVKRYPRYSSWVADAEKDLHEMIERYVLPDGGTMEGPGYWNYTFSMTLPILYILARYHKKELMDYVPPKVLKTGEYALCMLSSGADGTRYLPVNDAHYQQYAPIISACFAQMTTDAIWKKLYARVMSTANATPDKAFMIMAQLPEKDTAGPLLPAGFVHLPDIGQTSLIQESKDVGKIRLHLVSGPTYFGHFHEDKGSFIIEADGEVLALDRGICNYSVPYTSVISKAYAHNLLMPEAEKGAAYVQPRDMAGGIVTHAAFQNGCLSYTTENTQAWKAGIFTKNLRRFFSPDPHVYIIHDYVSYKQPTCSSFRLNTKGEMTERNGIYTVYGNKAVLRIIPVNWTPLSSWMGEDGYDSELLPVNQLRLFTDKAASHSLITAIEVTARDKHCLRRISPQELEYHQQIKCVCDKDKLDIIMQTQSFHAEDVVWQVIAPAE